MQESDLDLHAQVTIVGLPRTCFPLQSGSRSIAQVKALHPLQELGVLGVGKWHANHDDTPAHHSVTHITKWSSFDMA